MYPQSPLNRFSLLVTLSLVACSCGATGMLKEIGTGSADGYNHFDQFWVPFDGDVIFRAAPDGSIWRTDGTSTGTRMIQPSVGALEIPQSEFPGAISADHAVFFVADDSFYGAELWRTDGTVGGALRLTDLQPGNQPAGIAYYNASNGQYFFSTNTNYTLYTTDGSNPASVLQIDGGSAAYAAGGHVLENRGKYYYGCDQNYLGGPCVYDPVAGTVTLLKQLQSNSNFVAVNEKVFFTAKTTAEGTELWVTDGTPAGTQMVMDIATGTPDSNPGSLTRMDDKLYFIARDLTHGNELWSTDGTSAGTAMVADLNTGNGNGASAIYGEADGTLYFAGYSTAAGSELFRTDGTAANTVLVKDMAPGTPSGAGSATVINGSVFMSSPVGGAFSLTPWVSDGTQAGTRVLDPNIGLDFGYNMLAANGKLVFPGLLGSGHGMEPLEMNLERITGHKWCSKPEKTIPDAVGTTPGTLSDTIKLPEWGSIQNMTVSVDIGHTHVNDLVVRLKAPDATSSNLISRPLDGIRSCQGDLIAVQLSDAALLPVQSKCASTRFAYPPHSVYQPAQPLSTFAGKSTKGQWTLQVSDAAASNIGTLHEWCVDFNTDRIFFHDFED